MTDLREEWWTQRRAIAEACKRGGHVLITGLGLGLVVESMLQTPGSSVEKVTILEASGDVVALVAEYLETKYAGRVWTHEASAFDWEPPTGEHYTVAWHDIWPNPHDAGRWPEMEILEQHYRPFCDWQGCWVRDYLEAEKKFDARRRCSGD